MNKSMKKQLLKLSGGTLYGEHVEYFELDAAAKERQSRWPLQRPMMLIVACKLYPTRHLAEEIGVTDINLRNWCSGSARVFPEHFPKIIAAIRSRMHR